jgi:hypothetical protein
VLCWKNLGCCQRVPVFVPKLTVFEAKSSEIRNTKTALVAKKATFLNSVCWAWLKDNSKIYLPFWVLMLYWKNNADLSKQVKNCPNLKFSPKQILKFYLNMIKVNIKNYNMTFLHRCLKQISSHSAQPFQS